MNVVLGSERAAASGGMGTLVLLGDAVWPGGGGRLLVVAVVLSTVATLQTTLLQVTRSLFAMGRDRTVPPRSGPCTGGGTPRGWPSARSGRWRWRCSWRRTRWGRCGHPESAVRAIGLQIAFYYGLAGVAAVVAYRRVLLSSVREFLLGGVWPLAGAGFMLWVFFASLAELPPRRS